jgi:hypothetical protein
MTPEDNWKNRRRMLLMAGSALAGAACGMGPADIANLAHAAVAAWTTAFPVVDPASTVKVLFAGALGWLEAGTHLLQDWAGGWIETLSSTARSSVEAVKEAFAPHPHRGGRRPDPERLERGRRGRRPLATGRAGRHAADR